MYHCDVGGQVLPSGSPGFQHTGAQREAPIMAGRNGKNLRASRDGCGKNEQVEEISIQSPGSGKTKGDRSGHVRSRKRGGHWSGKDDVGIVFHEFLVCAAQVADGVHFKIDTPGGPGDKLSFLGGAGFLCLQDLLIYPEIAQAIVVDLCGPMIQIVGFDQFKTHFFDPVLNRSGSFSRHNSAHLQSVI